MKIVVRAAGAQSLQPHFVIAPQPVPIASLVVDVEQTLNPEGHAFLQPQRVVLESTGNPAAQLVLNGMRVLVNQVVLALKEPLFRIAEGSFRVVPPTLSEDNGRNTFAPSAVPSRDLFSSPSFPDIFARIVSPLIRDDALELVTVVCGDVQCRSRVIGLDAPLFGEEHHRCIEVVVHRLFNTRRDFAGKHNGRRNSRRLQPVHVPVNVHPNCAAGLNGAELVQVPRYWPI